MEIIVSADGPCTTTGTVTWPGFQVACSLGRTGISLDKREGDGATPAGRYPLRRVLYRADRIPRPTTYLTVRAIGEADGWCDDPGSPDYNQPIRLPVPVSHERLWRTDALYDLVVIIGHNDRPPVAGKGSAIFIHCRRADGGPTEGCIAMARSDLTGLVSACRPDAYVRILPP